MSKATTIMRAYHGEPATKAKYLRRVREHREADQLAQLHGYWEDGKGCGVGCTIHSSEHVRYETELGIPALLAHLEDAIFEWLPAEQAQQWPERFLKAINVGADLSRVWHQFAHWLLMDSRLLTVTDTNCAALELVAALHARAASGGVVTLPEWSAAAWAAWSAAWAAESAESAWSAEARAAWSAARAAACAAESAASAESAESAWSAEAWAASAAWSAAWSAESAAWSAAWSRMADKLIELLAAAPTSTKGA